MLYSLILIILDYYLFRMYVMYIRMYDIYIYIKYMFF